MYNYVRRKYRAIFYNLFLFMRLSEEKNKTKKNPKKKPT